MSEQDQIEQGHEAQGLAEQQRAEQERAEAYRDLQEARLRACGDAAAEVVKAAEEREKWKSEYGRLLAENLRLIKAWRERASRFMATADRYSEEEHELRHACLARSEEIDCCANELENAQSSNDKVSDGCRQRAHDGTTSV